ncbi:MAG: NADH-ubiquinone oxidoreductase chain N, partial [uncultured Friedmanniella sp.]
DHDRHGGPGHRGPGPGLRPADAVHPGLRGRLPGHPGGGPGAAGDAATGADRSHRADHRRRVRRQRPQLGRRPGGHRRRRLAGRRRPDRLHVGAAAGAGPGLDPHLRRACRRPRLRRPGRHRARQPGRAGGDRGPGGAHRGLPAGAVRAGRDDDVPGVQRPDHHVRGAGGAVPAAVPALRAGPAPAPAVPGGRAQVLPARCPVLGDLPLRRRTALRLRRLVRARRHRRRPDRRHRQPRVAARRHGSGRRRAAVQGRRGAVPLLDPRRLRRCPHAGHRLHGGLHQDRRHRRPAAGVLRGPGRRPLGLAAADVDRGGGHHGSGLLAGHHPDRRQADAGLLLHRPRGLHPDRLRRCLPDRDRRPRRLPDQRLLHLVLPGGLRGGHHRRLRAGHHGPRRQRRGEPAVQLDRPGPAFAADRTGVRPVPAELRRHPADQRFHRQVGRLRGGLDRWRALAGRGRGGDQRRRGLLLPPGHRADVLLRPGAGPLRRHRRAGGPSAGRHPARRGRGCGHHRRARGLPRPGAGPRAAGRGVPAL